MNKSHGGKQKSHNKAMASWGSPIINQGSAKNTPCMEHMTFSFRLQKDICDALWEKWDMNLTQRGDYRVFIFYETIIVL